MTLSATLLMMVSMAASGAASGAAGDAKGGTSTSRPAPIATATARAEIVRPVSVRIRRKGSIIEVDAPEAQAPQAKRDESGTLWVEFS
jgi:hypothetical protein